jgi:hypothetical protein
MNRQDKQDLLDCIADGAENVLVYGQSSHDDDNPYLPDDTAEHLYYMAYRFGAQAAEKLIAHIQSG